jgi:tetratricopeptide (TPR) repeat protein
VATIGGNWGAISRARLAEVKEKPTESLDAYESVLHAIAYCRDDISVTKHAVVRDALERAVKSDPGYADAWAFLSFSYLDEYRFNYNPRPDPLKRALDAARRAVTSDPANQFAHLILAMAFFFRHELDAFFAEVERTLALNPNDAGSLSELGRLMLHAGDERGITLARKAIALDPFHPTWFHFPIAGYHFGRGEYEEALAAARRIDIPDNFNTHVYLAAIYAELGRQSEAHSALEELRKVYPDFTIEKLIHERRKYNASDDTIRHWAAALRKAGLPE